MKILVLVWLGVLGAVFGSFVCCQAWRLHEKSEGKKLGKRSRCLKCHYQLRWYDNIPVFSWLLLGGRCRKCRKPIGAAEILSEISLAAVFVLVGLKMWGSPLQMGLMLALVSILWLLAIYDAKWGELPTGALVASNFVAVLYLVATAWGMDWKLDLMQVASSIGILAGTYYLLYFFSKEKLVGGGDWILCLAIALGLIYWQKAIMELFLANFLALVVSAPLAITKKQKQIAFGPFLVAAFVFIILVA